MIVLSATTDNLQVVLNAAHTTAALQCVAVWRDITTTAYTAGRTRTTTNGTTDVNLVAAPAASTQRVIDYISVYNSDTGAKTVTVKLDDNGTEAILWKGSLAVGEKVEYTDAKGFQLFDLNGIQKVTSVQAGASYITNALNVVALAADVTNNNAVANTIADVTGLSFAVNANETYYFKFTIFYTAAATTTGSRWSINGPAAPTLLAFQSSNLLTAAAGTDGMTVSYNSAYDTPAASNATSALLGNIAIVEGFVRPSASGTVIARFASEVASSAIVAKAGSICQWVRTL
jgi:hypothetical protein